MSFPVIEIKSKTKQYPKLLAQITDSPKQLYCRGNIKLLNSFCIGIVGTRKFTSYGKEATEHIVIGLADSRVTIVSGLAFGVDSVAHQTALDNGLPTIAVLGTGIDDKSIYPNSNLTLAQEILKNEGLIVSEYPPGSKGYKGNFPARNRIISGLSKGVLIVEAPEKSGALITTAFATEQNRDVFAVPGNIFSLNSKGPNMLIQRGAKPVFSAQDILGTYYQNLELNLQPKSHISTKDPAERTILAILDEKGEQTMDEIIRGSGIEAPQILAAISMLEIRGRIKQRSGKYQKI